MKAIKDGKGYPVGVIPNGFPAYMIATTHVATASANKTFATQLAELFTAYSRLSDELKRRCFIVFTTASSEQKIPITGITDGSGVSFSLSSSTQTSVMFNMKFGLYRTSNLTTSTGSTLAIQDHSSDTNSYPLSLYLT